MARGKNLSDLVFNKAQLIAIESLQPITDYLLNPERMVSMKLEKPEKVELLARSEFSDDEAYKTYKLEQLGINPTTMTGVLDVNGTLMYRSGSMGADCTELTSYEGLKRQTTEMIEAGVKRIVLKVDSNGGMAHGMFSASNYIAKLAKQNNVPTVAYVDGNAYSAAYGLTSLADEVIAHPQSSVGSIGVVVALHNDSKMLDKAGIKRQFVFAGENKIPFDNSTGEFTDKFLTDLQKSVNKTYASFVKHIATNRGISEQVVIDTQASVFDTDEAMQIGLIDKVMELEDFEVAYGIKNPPSVNTTGNFFMEHPVDNVKQKQEDNMPDIKLDVGDLQLELSAVRGQLETALEEKTNLTASLTDVQAAYDTAKEQLEVMKIELAEVKQAKEALEQDKIKVELEAKLAQRTSKLEAALGKDNEQVAKLLATTENLTDEQFDVIAESLSTHQDAMAMKVGQELGGEGQETEKFLTFGQQIAQKAKQLKS